MGETNFIFSKTNYFLSVNIYLSFYLFYFRYFTYLENNMYIIFWWAQFNARPGSREKRTEGPWKSPKGWKCDRGWLTKAQNNESSGKTIARELHFVAHSQSLLCWLQCGGFCALLCNVAKMTKKKKKGIWTLGVNPFFFLNRLSH